MPKIRSETVVIGIVIFLITLLAATLALKAPVQDNRTTERGDQSNVLIISFDTEYPIGIGFPDDMGADEAKEYRPTEEGWKATMKDLRNLATGQGIAFQFNIVGMTAESYPNITRNLANAGMGISCHGYAHIRQSDLSEEEMRRDAAQCKKAVETIIRRPIQGNRFPYTNYTAISHKILEDAGFRWDSSVWSPVLEPYKHGELVQIPIFPIPNDWGWFVLQRKNDSQGFFDTFRQNIEKPGVHTLLLHPWVLSLQRKENIRNLGSLIQFAKENNIPVKTADQVYEGYINSS